MTVLLDENFGSVAALWPTPPAQPHWNLNGYSWAPHYPNTGNSQETQAYDSSALSIKAGMPGAAGNCLLIRAAHTPYTLPNGVVMPYTSGLIQTKGKVAFTGGTVTVRAKLPIGEGVWPAIWLLPDDGSWSNEVDIEESWGDASSVTWNLFWGSATKTMHSQTVALDPTTWHDYTVEWVSGTSLVYKIDGVTVGTVTDPVKVPAKPMYLLINLAIRGGLVTDLTRYPKYMAIDRVLIATP